MDFLIHSTPGSILNHYRWDSGLIPVRRIPWSRKWQPTPVFLPGKCYGQSSLGDCSPWGHSQTWRRAHTQTSCRRRTQLCLNTREMDWMHFSILVSQTTRFWYMFNKGSSWHLLTSFKNRNLGAGIKATHFLFAYKSREGQAHSHNHHAPSTILNTLCSWNASK